MSEIHLTVLSLKNNKASIPGDISTKFFKAFFNPARSISFHNDPSQEVTYSGCVK